MDSPLLYGSVVLAATTPLQSFPMFEDARTLNGNFTGGHYRGSHSLLAPDALEKHLALPQRGKYMISYVLAAAVHQMPIANALARSLVDLDVRFEDARQLYKSQQLMNEVQNPSPYIAVISNTNEHPFFNLLVQGFTLHLIGVFDTVNRSVRLVFTTDPGFIEKVRAGDFTRYAFYRFAPVIDRPVFLHTQTLCSRWYYWTKAYRNMDGVLRCFNVLEHFLLRDSNIPQLQTA